MPNGPGEQEPAGSQTAGCWIGRGHSPADQCGVWGLLSWPCGSSRLSASRTGQWGRPRAWHPLRAKHGTLRRHPPLLRLAAARGVRCSSWPEQKDRHGDWLPGFSDSRNIARKMQHGRAGIFTSGLAARSRSFDSMQI